MLFNPSSTPIICSPKFERFGFERQHLLVPLLAWKVLAPGRNARNVNLFQKTILKLIRAGVVHSSEIADHMALDPELVKFIIAAQLQPNGLLDKSFKLTSEAEEALDDGIIGGKELSTAYLFQEPWSGKLLPVLQMPSKPSNPTSLTTKDSQPSCAAAEKVNTKNRFASRPPGFLIRQIPRRSLRHWSWQKPPDSTVCRSVGIGQNHAPSSPGATSLWTSALFRFWPGAT